MSVKLGLEAKLYLSAAGIKTPSWTLLESVKNVTLNLQKGEADVTSRASNGWKAIKGTLKEASIEFELLWDPEEEGFVALRDAYLNGTKVGLAVMDGEVAAAGSEGLWADCEILDFSHEQPLEEALTVKVTAKPTYSDTPPQWKTIAGA